MSPERRQSALTWLSFAALASLFGAGSAWGVVSYRQNAMEVTIARIDRRVTLLYCNSLPVADQAKCKEQLVQ